MPYSILRAVQDPKYCAISKRPHEMKNHARPARGVSMQESYPDVLDFEMSKLVNPNGLQIADVIPNPIQYVIVTQRMKEFLEKEASGPIEFLPDFGIGRVLGRLRGLGRRGDGRTHWYGRLDSGRVGYLGCPLVAAASPKGHAGNGQGDEK